VWGRRVDGEGFDLGCVGGGDEKTLELRRGLWGVIGRDM
jgi:hypothetical protein